MPLTQVFVLESGGGLPEDTVVAVPPEGRVIVLRRGPPDNTLFVQLVAPMDSTTRLARAKDSAAKLARVKDSAAKVPVSKDSVAKIAAPRDSAAKLPVPKDSGAKLAPTKSLVAKLAELKDSAATKVALHPRPGIFGLDIEASRALPAGVVLSFSYALQFVAPAGARERYGSDIAFERELMIARIGSDSIVTFFLTKRLGSDLVSAVIPGAGRYVVAAPR